MRKIWEALWRFLIEIMVGTVIFFVIALAAVGLNFFVRFLETRDVDLLIVWGLIGAEYTLFIVDLVMFGRFLWKTAQRMWYRL